MLLFDTLYNTVQMISCSKYGMCADSLPMHLLFYNIQSILIFHVKKKIALMYLFKQHT